jgi:hypothetical protein
LDSSGRTIEFATTTAKAQKLIKTGIPPPHIKLKIESGELSWHTASDTWIPEDGLYDHLVLKLVKDRTPNMMVIAKTTIVPPSA